MISTANLVAWTKAVSGEETILRSLERAAVAYVNEPGGRYFGARTTITETHRWRGGAILLGNEVALAGAETFAIDEWDGAAWVAVAASRYILAGRLLYLTGTVTFAGTHLRIAYPAGYTPSGGDADVWAAPEDIQQAVRMLVSHWYVNREAAVVGVASEEVALAVSAILAKYR